MENKINNVKRFEDVVALLEGKSPKYLTVEEAVAFIKKQAEQTAKKNSGKSKKEDAVKKAQNEKYMPMIVDLLRSLPADDPGLTCGEILRRVPGMFEEGLGSQKVALLVGKRPGMLGDMGFVTSAKVKGETRYRMAPDAPAFMEVDGEEVLAELEEADD